MRPWRRTGTAKRGLYEHAGIGHYLLIDPITQTIEWLQLGDQGTFLDRSGDIASANRLSLTLADGCQIDIDRQVTFA